MVRIWRVPFRVLKHPRDVGEHHETHTAMTVLTKIRLGIKGGYQHFPLILRFVGHEGMLITRHREQVKVFRERGYPCGFNHPSPIPQLFLKLFKPEPYTYTDEEFKQDLALLQSRQKG